MTLGYTLIEMLITLTIASILLVIVIPNQHFLWQRSQHVVLSEQLLQAINLTRHTAIVEQITTTLCPSDNQHTCSGSWDAGYIIKTQANTLRAFTNVPHQGKLHWRSFPANHNALVFTETGATAFENGTFWYCEPDATSASFAIVVSQMGRARLVKSTVMDVDC